MSKGELFINAFSPDTQEENRRYNVTRQKLDTI